MVTSFSAATVFYWIATLAAAAADPAGGDAASWTPLFDGASTKGWLEVTGQPFPASSWKIEDGCLRAIDTGGGLQDLRTELTFGPEFELEFEWKIQAGGNSGVKYYVQKTDHWVNAKGRQARARGLEYQIQDDAAVENGRKKTAALYDVFEPRSFAAKPLGEFNVSRIRVRGGEVEHWLNGAKVAAFRLDQPEVQGILRKNAGGVSPLPAQPAYVSLQNHGTPVWFRNIRIRTQF